MRGNSQPECHGGMAIDGTISLPDGMLFLSENCRNCVMSLRTLECFSTLSINICSSQSDLIVQNLTLCKGSGKSLRRSTLALCNSGIKLVALPKEVHYTLDWDQRAVLVRHFYKRAGGFTVDGTGGFFDEQ
jgi:hypothetical protein